MSDFLIDALTQTDEPHVVQATLVSATGSSSKKIGAKMLVGASGKLLGGVTIGGCVDAQVIEAGDALIARGGRHLLDISLDDDEAWEIGLTCGGNVEVMVERIAPADVNDPLVAAYVAVRAALAADRAIVVATLIGGEPGAITLDENGASAGTLGGASLDAEARAVAADVFRSGSRDATVTTPSGTRRIFFDRFAPPTTLVIVGAGQIAMSLTALARELDMRTIVVDGRERYATPDRFPFADSIRVGMPSEIVAGITPTKRVAAILVAHDYKYELPVLRQLLRAPVGYLGMLGSKKRSVAVRDILRDEGFTDAELARIHTPIGLDLGGKSSPEVALSILAEIVAVRSGKRA
ncbi:MAG: XdhC family protein [Gemmatimonadaceae bacterium]